MKLESGIEEEACRRVLHELGVFSVRLTRTSENGNVDRVFLLPKGKTLWAEFKRPDEEPRGNQQMIHERLRHFQHSVVILTSVESTLNTVRYYLHHG